MSNKETLQANNEILTGNNEEIDAMMAAIENLPPAILKPDSYTVGNVGIFDANGNIIDGGIAFRVIDGVLQIVYDDGSEE